MKKEASGLFVVAMGSYNGTELCELVGMLVLSQLPKQYNRCDIERYRDDGLAVFSVMSGSMAECAKKDITKSLNTSAYGLPFNQISRLSTSLT